MSSSPTGPLQGVTVVDFSQAAAGPFCTQHLGDLGADIIKVEPPEGDMIRGWNDEEWAGLGTYFMGLNRNKRSVCLDLKSQVGRAVAEKLCARADVVVENYRPGTMARLGLSYDDLRKANPRLIYVAISAFGESGPLKDAPGMDIVLQAFGGIMGITGSEDSEPVKVGSPVADLATGYAAAMATLGALYAREVRGHGQRVSLSMLNVVVSLLSNHTTGHLLHGTPVNRHGSAHPQLVPYQAFETMSGEYIVIGILNERFWGKFCEATELAAVHEDPRFASNRERVRNRRALLDIIIPLIRSRPISEWEEIFEAHDVPYTRVNSFESLFSHPQVGAAGVVQHIEHPMMGDVPVIAQPAHYSEDSVSYRLAPPILGEHTIEVLNQFGIEPELLAELAKSRESKVSQ